MKLLTNQQSFTEDKPRRTRRPVNVFKACPACKGELLEAGIDVLCVDCDWMSAEAHVEAGGTENLLQAAREHLGNADPEPEPQPLIFTPKAARFEIENEEPFYENAN